MTQFEDRTPDWLPVGEALDRVLSTAGPLEPEKLPLTDARGRALAQDIFATATLPPWDNSAMDGYAVRAGDLVGASRENPLVLRVIGEIKAGDLAGRVLAGGEAIRIMTGAPVPPGADAIVRVEETDAEESAPQVRIFHAPAPGDDIRPGGQDMADGEMLLRRGTTVGPGQIGLLAATGAERVSVHSRPRVAILSNGDEIAPLEQFYRVRAGKAIPETNGHALAVAVLGADAVPVPLGIAADTAESIQEKVNRARDLDAHVLVTSGGASMGEFDLFKRVLDEMDFDLDFWRVKMRPGTPFSFGKLPRRGSRGPLYVFGLPGNPASSFVTFQIFCRPFLLRLAGHETIHRQVIQATAGEDFRSPAHLTHFFRVTLSGDPIRPEARKTGPQTSGLVRGQGLAQGLAVVPEGVEKLEVGSTVRVILLDDFGHGLKDPGFLPL